MLDLDYIYCRLQEQLNTPHYWDILWENVRLFLVYNKLHRNHLGVYQPDGDKHLSDIYLAVALL